MNMRLEKPTWFKRRLPTGPEYEKVRGLVDSFHLHTVCQEARCPNQWECFSDQTATFLIMGPACTRNCRFCAVQKSPVAPPDPEEPQRVAQAASTLGLSYVVITSVTRDDLDDGGASVFAETITEVKKICDGVRIEVLVPDFQGDMRALQQVIAAGPDVLNHNIETVPRLYETVRPQADYQRSLDIFRYLRGSSPKLPTKSGLMLGLGEKDDEIKATLVDLVTAGCKLLTLGQYLQPTKDHLPVERYVTPEEFDQWRSTALKIGFVEAVSGPLVRSSYQAGKLLGHCAK
ncbi:MAG: lipoyl synthase [Desulfobulbaceae bacterium]|nr:lipoyl synthase [Desulfobulbaceae bacterium]